jgi:hypothetical protein
MLDFINGSGNRMDNVEYWTIAENIGVQGASEILEMEKQKQKTMMQQQAQIPTVNQPPEQIPTEAPQGDMMDEVLKGLTPEELADIEQNPELLQQAMSGG